jgi:hypothetical protein
VKQLVLMISIIGLTLVTHGCAFYQAAKEPGVRDVGVFAQGTPREHVIAAFGEPIHTNLDKPGSYKSEVYQFVQGDGIAIKSLKATGRTVLDLMTVALVAYTGQLGGLQMLAQKNNWYSRDITVYKVIFDTDDKILLSQKINIKSPSDVYPLIKKPEPKPFKVTYRSLLK